MDGYEKFKKDILKLIDIDLSAYKEKQMKRRINSLASRNNFYNFDDYFKELTKNKDLLREFVNYLTINVSEFYRNPVQWRVLEEKIIPEIIKYRKTLKVWSSACSTGEEPYSLVMLLSNFFDIDKIDVLATDIDKEAISKAKIGVYDKKSLKNLPCNFKNKYFKKIQNTYKINEEIKKRVTFKEINLLKEAYPKGYDLILCRNVMIYFTEEAKEKIYSRFYNSLNDEGVLFVGSTEQIIFPQKYNFKSEDTFFYKKGSL